MAALRAATSFASVPAIPLNRGRVGGGVGPESFTPGVSFGKDAIIPITFDREGLPSPGTFNQTEHPSNTFIQASYVCKRYADGSDLQILPGMFFFLERVDDRLALGKRTINQARTITLGHLNNMLWASWQRFTQALVKGDPKATRFYKLMSKFSEREVAAFAHDKLTRATSAFPAAPATDPGVTATDIGELQELLGLINANEDLANCAGPSFILSRFNFGGVILNRSNDVTLDGIASLGSLSFIFGVNTISSHLAEVHDIFPQVAEMGVGTDLFLHLHRRRVANPPAAVDGYGFGAFVMEPIATFTQTRPIIRHSYRDMANIPQSGSLLELGKVHINGNRTDNFLTQRIASGMDPVNDLSQVRDATARLDKIVINLQKKK
jgi:hypothetical protein